MEITFKKLSYKNFLSTGANTISLDFSKYSRFLIAGKNGSGKSSVLDALHFVLFNEGFRDINKPQLVNYHNKKNCEVQLEFRAGNKEYKVVRKIKPNDFQIFEDGKLLDKNAMSLDYQDHLEDKIIKMNKHTFKHFVTPGRGDKDFTSFMSATPKQRRAIIEEILNVAIYSRMAEILSGWIKETNGKVQVSKSKLTELVAKTQAQIDIIKSLSAVSKERIRELNNKINNNNSRVEEIKKEGSINADKIKTIENEKETVKKQTGDNLEKNIMQEQRFILTKNNEIKVLNKDLKFYESHQNCPTCMQTIDKKFQEDIIEVKSKNRDKLNNEVIDHKKKLVDYERLLTKKNDELDNLDNKISDLTSKNNVLRQTIIMLREENNKYNDEILKLDGKNDRIEESKKEKDRLITLGLKTSAEKKSLLEEENVQKMCQKLLKDDGIKSAIIKEYIGELNRLVNKYLEIFNANTAFFLDEKFEETIKARYQTNMGYNSFSQGERMRVDIALLMAWRDIAKMNNYVNVNILIMDEVFDSSLDDEGVECFILLLKKLSKTIKNVGIMSHTNKEIMAENFEASVEFKKNSQNFSYATWTERGN